MGEGGSRAMVASAVAIGAIIAGVGLARVETRQPPTAVPLPVTTRISEIEVHVSGWVASPGVVSLPAGSLIADAVAAAGGMRPGAAVGSLNLAAPAQNGQQVIVPGPHASVATPGEGRVSINLATTAELEGLPGVGPVLASRIVEHRDRHGPFAEIEDLLDVPGIGEAKLASLREHVSP